MTGYRQVTIVHKYTHIPVGHILTSLPGGGGGGGGCISNQSAEGSLDFLTSKDRTIYIYICLSASLSLSNVLS